MKAERKIKNSEIRKMNSEKRKQKVEKINSPINF